MKKNPNISRRKFLRTTTAAGIAVAANVALSDAQVPQVAPPAGEPAQGLMLVNGRIHTMDAQATIANTLTIRNGRFAAVGDVPPRGAAPAGMQVIDLGGRTVVPGLIESHLHGMDMGSRPGYHVPEVESAADIRGVQEVLAAARKKVPEGQWITAIGVWAPDLWPEHRPPTLKELDDAVPDRPIFMFESFNGVAATNTLGKKFFDTADAGPLPHPDYRGVKVAANGAIGASHVTDGGPSTSALYLLRRTQVFDDKIRNTLGTMDYSTSLGLTSWLDKNTIYALGPLHPRQGSAGVNPYREWDPWNVLHREGRMSIRVQFDFTCFAEVDPENTMLKEYLENQLPFFGDDMLRTGGIGEWPAPRAQVAQWRAANRIVAQAGWRCDNDANNVMGLKEIVEDYEDLTKQTDITGLRWNVNLLGANVYDAELLTRLKALGCSVQMCANRWLRAADRKAVAGPEFRSILDHGITPGLFGNGTHISPLNPWLHMYYVITGVNSFGNQVNSDQHLTRAEGLRLRTRANSYFMQMEDKIGSIEPGKLADLAVLDRDYFSVPDIEIKRIHSVLTVVNGRIVHDTGAIRLPQA